MLTTVDRQINANQQERAILQTARMAYARRIQELLPNLEISETEPENLIVSLEAGSISCWHKYLKKEYSITVKDTIPEDGKPFSKIFNKKKNILGHSDIAPLRKSDPGEKFPWIKLNKRKIGIWYSQNKKLNLIKKSKNNMNMKAVFLHNLSDALSSIAVIIAGLLIFLYKIYWIDTALTFFVAGLILWQAMKLLPNTIHLLMEGSPKNILPKDIKESIKNIVGIKAVSYTHLTLPTKRIV